MTEDGVDGVQVVRAGNVRGQEMIQGRPGQRRQDCLEIRKVRGGAVHGDEFPGAAKDLVQVSTSVLCGRSGRFEQLIDDEEGERRNGGKAEDGEPGAYEEAGQGVCHRLGDLVGIMGFICSDEGVGDGESIADGPRQDHLEQLDDELLLTFDLFLTFDLDVLVRGRLVDLILGLVCRTWAGAVRRRLGQVVGVLALRRIFVGHGLDRLVDLRLDLVLNLIGVVPLDFHTQVRRV
ncbi:hypothetical protein [Actinomadura fibrosa]|uniref:Uncharacterized protein n=1 Tax=Actinomadura fibrosa TaxID=111802 RepID=A0ABW2XAJ1_9ACTN|nr:hypothetical protein [Actinomadura fibrosa]